MTAEQIGRALGFSEPDKSISNLYNRYEDELKEYRVLINLVKNPNGGRPTYGYMEEGIYTICMLARTETAKVFRRRVSKHLKELRHRQIGEARLQAARASARVVLGLERNLVAKGRDISFLKRVNEYRTYHKLTQADTGRLLGVSKDTVKRYEKLLRETGLAEIL